MYVASATNTSARWLADAMASGVCVVEGPNVQVIQHLDSARINVALHHDP